MRIMLLDAPNTLNVILDLENTSNFVNTVVPHCERFVSTFDVKDGQICVFDVTKGVSAHAPLVGVYWVKTSLFQTFDNR